MRCRIGDTPALVRETKAVLSVVPSGTPPAFILDRARPQASGRHVMGGDDTNHTDKALERTDLAEDRTVLAHERTFAGWVRTAMAAVGIGLAFHALFQALSPAWVAKAIASTFLATGIFIVRSAELRARHVLDRLEPHNVTALKPVRIRLLSWTVMLATVALGIAIWLLV